MEKHLSCVGIGRGSHLVEAKTRLPDKGQLPARLGNVNTHFQPPLAAHPYGQPPSPSSPRLFIRRNLQPHKRRCCEQKATTQYFNHTIYTS